MTDKQVQAKLNQLARLCDELRAEAHRRYGSEGNLFFESDGHFHLMAGDLTEGEVSQRQQYVRFSSVFCSLGTGSW